MTRSLKIVLPVALLVAMAAAAWFLVIAPKREEAARLSAEVAAADAELADLQAKVADYTKARERYPSDVATVTRLGKAVPADDDTGSLMVQLDSASRRSGVDFSSIQLTGDAAGAAPAAGTANQTVTPGATIPGAVVVPGSDVSTMPFTFAFEGDYFGLSSFLAPAAKSRPAGGSAAAPSTGGATSTGGGGSTPATPEPTTNANASGAVQ